MGLVKSIDLKSKHKQLIKHYLSALLPRTQVWAYGSRVKWTARPSSDLDIVIFSQPKQKRQISKLKEMLEESNLPFNVDIFVWDHVPENFIPSIKKAYYVLQEQDDNKENVAWPLAKLGDHIQSCLGKMLDKNKNKGEYSPYLGNSNVRWGYFELDNLSNMKFEAHEHDKYGIKKGDLIVCEGGEPGRCAIWDCDIPDMKIQKALHRVRPLETLDAEYLYYWFLHAGKTGRLDPYFTGTTIKHLTGKSLAQLPIEIPPIEYQRHGANILRSLDKKIELNKQTNQTLEAMAQTLFKSWFVDFDPVFDNMLANANFTLENLASDLPEALLKRAQARLLGLSDDKKTQLLANKNTTHGATAQSNIHQHFPSEFEYNEELGWIPKGWVTTQIKDIASVVKGKSYKSSELSESNTALVTLKSFKRGGGYRLDGLKEYTGKYKKEQEVVAGDLIVAYTDVTQAADVIGKPAMVISDLRYEHLVVSLDVAVIRSYEEIHKNYLYGIMQTHKFQNHTRSYTTGTTVLHLKKEAVPEYWLALPTIDILTNFFEINNPIYSKIDTSIDENRTLTKLRDTLLPKLISGELPIPDGLKTTESSMTGLGSNNE